MYIFRNEFTPFNSIPPNCSANIHMHLARFPMLLYGPNQDNIFAFDEFSSFSADEDISFFSPPPADEAFFDEQTKDILPIQMVHQQSGSTNAIF